MYSYLHIPHTVKPLLFTTGAIDGDNGNAQETHLVWQVPVLTLRPGIVHLPNRWATYMAAPAVSPLQSMLVFLHLSNEF